MLYFRHSPEGHNFIYAPWNAISKCVSHIPSTTDTLPRHLTLHLPDAHDLSSSVNNLSPLLSVVCIINATAGGWGFFLPINWKYEHKMYTMLLTSLLLKVWSVHSLGTCQKSQHKPHPQTHNQNLHFNKITSDLCARSSLRTIALKKIILLVL